MELLGRTLECGKMVDSAFQLDESRCKSVEELCSTGELRKRTPRGGEMAGRAFSIDNWRCNGGG